MERNNGESFQKQAFLTFVQPLGMFCCEKNPIHGVGLGLRPEEAGQGAHKMSVSLECGARAGQPVGKPLFHWL